MKTYRLISLLITILFLCSCRGTNITGTWHRTDRQLPGAPEVKSLETAGDLIFSTDSTFIRKGVAIKDTSLVSVWYTEEAVTGTWSVKRHFLYLKIPDHDLEFRVKYKILRLGKKRLIILLFNSLERTKMATKEKYNKV
jgi:hypothetical protein